MQNCQCLWEGTDENSWEAREGPQRGRRGPLHALRRFGAYPATFCDASRVSSSYQGDTPALDLAPRSLSRAASVDGSTPPTSSRVACSPSGTLR